MKKIILGIFFPLLLFAALLTAQTQPAAPGASPAPAVAKTDRVGILWTSGDPDVAKKMVFLYTFNAKKMGWFKQVRFIVWGASTKLLSKDKELQEWIAKMKQIGVELYACKWCADSYGVSDQLAKMGITVIYFGKPLSEMIKDGWNILTF